MAELSIKVPSFEEFKEMHAKEHLGLTDVEVINEYYKTVPKEYTTADDYKYDNHVSSCFAPEDLPKIRDSFKPVKPTKYEPVDDISPLNFLLAYNKDPDMVIEMFIKHYAEALAKQKKDEVDVFELTEKNIVKNI